MGTLPFDYFRLPRFSKNDFSESLFFSAFVYSIIKEITHRSLDPALRAYRNITINKKAEW